MQFNHITAEHLTLKIAETPDEVAAAQALRYQVFYTEMGAHPVGDMAIVQRDYDHYDELCDHLIVMDEQEGRVVGTYRILQRDKADRFNIPLYTETEFNIDKLKASGGRIMEMSRSCIHPDYRSKTAINLLWKGIAACVFDNDIDFLIGVPSFNGTDLQDHLAAISYMNAFHATDDAIRPHVQPQFYQELALLKTEQIDKKAVFNALPPLFKGYLRIGVGVGEGFYIDQQFNMIDLCVVLDVANAANRYLNHYKRYDT